MPTCHMKPQATAKALAGASPTTPRVSSHTGRKARVAFGRLLASKPSTRAPGGLALWVRAAATLEAAPSDTDLLQLIPAGKGKATHLKKGDKLKIINSQGMQVVDFWAFSTDAWGEEIMSMHHTRNANQKLNPTAGDMLYTASMLPIMTFLEDSGPGQHDTTAAACSYGMYVHYLGEEAAKEHDSCTNNLHNSLAELGLKLADDHRFNYYTPQPLNLWQNMSDEPDETGFIYAPPHPQQKAGDYCTFRAEVDCVAVMSACPWDVSNMNGPGGTPKDCHFQVLAA